MLEDNCSIIVFEKLGIDTNKLDCEEIAQLLIHCVNRANRIEDNSGRVLSKKERKQITKDIVNLFIDYDSLFIREMVVVYEREGIEEFYTAFEELNYRKIELYNERIERDTRRRDKLANKKSNIVIVISLFSLVAAVFAILSY